MALTPEDVVNKRFQPTKFREGYDQDEVDDFLDEIVVELRRLGQENADLKKKLSECESRAKSTGADLDSLPPVLPSTPGAEEGADQSDVAGFTPEARGMDASFPATGSMQAAPQTGMQAVAAQSAPATGTVSAVDAPSFQAEGSAMSPLAGQNLSSTMSPEESATSVLVMAQRLHEEHVRDGVEKRDKIISDAQREASSLVAEAEERSRSTLEALEREQGTLERKIDQLRTFERDYRSRLKSYIESHLRDIDTHGSVFEEVEAAVSTDTGSEAQQAQVEEEQSGSAEAPQDRRARKQGQRSNGQDDPASEVRPNDSI